MANTNAKYRIQSRSGEYNTIHFETNSAQVLESDEKQFISKEEKALLKKLSSPVKEYEHNQVAPARTWNINHNLKCFPSVTIIDSANSVVIGDVIYTDNNNIKINFTSEFSGKAYLNR